MAGLGVLAALVIIEVAVRVSTDSLFVWGGNEAGDDVVTDPMLGRIIVAQGTRRHPTKGFTISIGEHGTRLGGEAKPRSPRPLILAVGDSFAFGDGVSDGDSWPAALEQASGGRVINGGMVGFGFDQAVLRAEQLAGIYHPDTIVLGFIPHDIERCEMSYWSGFSKPYFDLDSGALRLHPALVPQPSLVSFVKRVLSHSMTLDLLFTPTLHWQGPRELRVHDQGRQVACLLTQRLAVLAEAQRMRILVVAYPQQPESEAGHREIKDAVLACATASGLSTLDLFPAFESRTPDERARLFDRHFTVEGNRLVGSAIAGFLAAPAG